MIISLDDLVSQFNLNISGIVHVGAHRGHEYKIYKNLNINNLVFIEPLKNNFNILINSVEKNDNIILINKAAGSKKQTIKMFVEEDNESMSSSVLKPKLHLQQYEHIKFTKEELVEMDTLDSMVDNKLKYNFINIDVQGYELEVFKGSTELLKNINYIYTEINRAELYENNALVGDLDLFLSIFGFERVLTNWAGNTWGDALYIKRSE